METYTKWIMGHRRNLATVTFTCHRYVSRIIGEGNETGELRLCSIPSVAKLTSVLGIVLSGEGGYCGERLNDRNICNLAHQGLGLGARVHFLCLWREQCVGYLSGPEWCFRVAPLRKGDPAAS